MGDKINELRRDPAMLREAICEQGDDFFVKLLEGVKEMDTIYIGTKIVERFDDYLKAVAERSNCPHYDEAFKTGATMPSDMADESDK